MKFKFKPQRRHLPYIIIAVIALALLVGLVFSLLQKDSQTNSGDLYITPKNASASKNSDVTYVVRLSPDTPVDTVTATLSYDASKLSYKSVSYTNSPFGAQIPAIKKTGSVTIQSAKFDGDVTRDAFVASVVFTALDGGPADVKLSGNAAQAGVATNPTINGVGKAATLSLQRTAPWIIGLFLYLIATTIILIIHRRKHTLQSNNHKKTQDNTGKTDETA